MIQLAYNNYDFQIILKSATDHENAPIKQLRLTRSLKAARWDHPLQMIIKDGAAFPSIASFGLNN